MSIISGSCSESASHKLFRMGLQEQQQGIAQERQEEKRKNVTDVASNKQSETSTHASESFIGLNIDDYA